MKTFDRALGIVRSLAIYHGIPGRQRRLQKLYSPFVGPGDLAFDVGAHVGNRTRAMAALGCRVVALEPQPDFARVLRLLFRRSTCVTVVAAAVGAREESAELAISLRHPTVTTMAEPWRQARSRERDFAAVTWCATQRVPVVTLDSLIARFGVPAFVKIDVEGSEPDVLAGLSHPVPVLSFEYLRQAPELVRTCTERLGAIAPYVFNWSPGERGELTLREWVPASELMARLYEGGGQEPSGDVYARCVLPSSAR